MQRYIEPTYKTHTPAICMERNEVIDALERKEIVIFLMGEAARPLLKEIKSEVTRTKFGKLARNVGGLGLITTLFTPAGWATVLCFSVYTAFGALLSTGDEKNYGIGLFLRNGEDAVVLVKMKGDDRYNFTGDSLNDSIAITTGDFCPRCQQFQKINKKTGLCNKCKAKLVFIHKP